MTFKEAELEVSELKCELKRYSYEDYDDKTIEALTMAEEALCVLSDVKDIIRRYQGEDSDV